MTSLKRLFLLIALLCFTHCHAAEIKGEWSDLDEKLKAGDYSKLPTGTKKFGKNYYCLVLQKTNWFTAKKWCEDRGGHLATITTAEENNFMLELFHKPKTPQIVQYFIGGTDQLQEGEWKWVTGEPFKYTNWSATNPDNHAGIEHFMAIPPEHQGVWNDAPEVHVSITGFIIEWEGAKVDRKILSDPKLGFPKKLVSTHQIAQRRLEELKKSGNTQAFSKLIKSYGKKLVYEEKALTKQRKIKEAKAVQAVKLELIALLKKPNNKTAKPVSNASEKKIVLIKQGIPQQFLQYNRKHWRQTDDGLKSIQNEKPLLLKDLIIGDGDFSIKLVFQVNRIGGVGPAITIGETFFKFDADQSKLVAWYGAFNDQSREGERLAGKFAPNKYGEWILKRSGNEVIMLVNGKEMFRHPVSGYVLGKLSLKTTEAPVMIREFEISGNILPTRSKDVTIAWHQAPSLQYHSTQLLYYGDKTRTYLMTGHHYDINHSIWMKHYKKRLDPKPKTLLFEKHQGEGKFLMGLSVFPGMKNDAFAFFTEGKANHNVYFKYSKNKGKSWNKPEDITTIAKNKGWDAFMASPGLVKKYGTNKGRIIVPYSAGTEQRNLYILVQDKRRTWRRIGPIMKHCSNASITEMPDGKLLICSQVSRAKNAHIGTKIAWSTDGGETWGKESTIAQKLITYGSNIISLPTRKHPNLLLLTGTSSQLRTSIYYSTDLAKSWKLLEKVSPGKAWYPILTPLEKGKFTISMFQPRGSWERSQVRSYDFDLKDFDL